MDDLAVVTKLGHPIPNHSHAVSVSLNGDVICLTWTPFHSLSLYMYVYMQLIIQFL